MKNLVLSLMFVFSFCSISFSQSTFHHGPRIGATFFSGEMAKTLEDDYDSPIALSQFGYQFEVRYSVQENGSMGVFEIVPLFAGAEQNIIIPSLTTIIGYRMASALNHK